MDKKFIAVAYSVGANGEAKTYVWGSFGVANELRWIEVGQPFERAYHHALILTSDEAVAVRSAAQTHMLDDNRRVAILPVK